jgi:hypothetical protein
MWMGLELWARLKSSKKKTSIWYNFLYYNWLNLYFYKSLELISRKKRPPGPEAAISGPIQDNRSYHGFTDRFEVSNGSISNVMKLFIAGLTHVFTFLETQNPDRLDTFDFDKLTLEIITSARKHQTFKIFSKNLTIVMCNFAYNFRSIG